MHVTSPSRIKITGLLVFFVLFAHTPIFASSLSNEKPGEEEAAALFDAIDFGSFERPGFDIFSRALAGYNELKQAGRLSSKNLLTIIDFRMSANDKRLWVIDLSKKKALFHSLTAHGKNSGNVFARKFSNTPNSNQSSLGFYVTGKTYIGKHGISLKLHGMEKGINDMAEARAIVMHGADYVSESHIKKYGRLGRSFGCPAVPIGLHKKLIPLIADGTCLFIFSSDPAYLSTSDFSQEGELDLSVNSGQ